MYELNGQQYSLEDLNEIAKIKNYSLEELLSKNPSIKKIEDTAGKLTSQGPGAPVAETAAPDQISTESTLEDGSLVSPVNEELSWGDIFSGVIENIKPAVLSSWESTKGASLDWLKKVAGEDAADFLIGKNEGAIAFVDPNNGDKITFQKNKKRWLELSEADQDLGVEIKKVYNTSDKEVGAATEKAMLDMFNKATSYNLQQKDLGGFISGVKEGNLKDIVGGGLTSITSLITTMVPAIATRGHSLMPQMYGDMYVSYNEAKAKEKYGDDPDAFKKLVENNETEVSTPLALAGLAAALEKVGLKGITKAIAGSTIKGKGAILKLWSMLGEGTTEYAQTLVESYNESLGAGKSQTEALSEVVNAMGSEEAWEAAIQGAFGAGVISGVGGAVKKINAKARKNTGNAVGASLDILGILRQREAIATDPDVKEGIKKQIAEVENSIKEKVNKGNEIVENLSENDSKEIIKADNALEVFKQKIADLNEKAKNGEITPDEQAIAREGFQAEFKKAKEKIDKIIADPENKPQYSNLQDLYDKYDGNVNKMVNETLTKNSKGATVNEKVENSIFGTQVGKLAESLTKKLFDPITPDARNGVTREEYKRTIINNAATIVATEKFDPAKQNLDKFLSSRLYLRTNALAGELGIESIQEQGGMGIAQDVTTVKDAMATETAEDTVQASETIKETSAQPKLVSKIKFENKGLNLFANAAKKALSGRLPSVTDSKAFKKSLDNSFRTSLTTAMKNFSGTRKVYDQFLKENWETLYNAIPQDVINKRFPEFNKPVIDPKTGKQKRLTMAEGTAAGELVFEKRNDVTQEEFLKYMNAPGSTKAARKNALAEMLATQVGFDEVIDALADPEINKKFKEIQELQGFEVPSNYAAQIAKTIDRLDAYAAKIQSDPNILRSSFGVDIIAENAFKAFIKAVQTALKGGATLLDALNKGYKVIERSLATKKAKKELKDLIDSKFAELSDLNEANINDFANKFANISAAELKDTGIKEGAIGSLKSKLSDNNISIEAKANIVKDFILQEYDSIRVRTQAAKGTYTKNTFFNETLAPLLKETAPELLGANGFEVKPQGKTQYKLFFNGAKLNSNSKLKPLLQKQDTEKILAIQAASKKYITDKLLSYIKSGKRDEGVAHFKLLTGGTEAAFRNMGAFNTHVDGLTNKEARVEHDPPIETIFQEIEKALRGEVPVQKVIELIDNSHINLIPVTVDKILESEGLKQAMPEGADIYKDPHARMKNPKVVAEMNKYKKNTKSFLGSKTEQANQPIVEAEINATETVIPPSDKESRVMASAIDDMVQRKKGISKERTVSAVEAKAIGKGKGRFKIFIPPSAEDFKGLIYSLMGSGKQGDIDAEFFSEKLFKPLAKANYILNAERQNLKAKFKNLIDNNKGITKELRKESGYSFFSNDHAVRVFMWNKLGYEIPGLSGKEQSALIKIVEDNPKLKKFAEEIIVIPNKNESWLQPKEEWAASTVEMDLQETISKTGRKRIFAEFIQNADIIFNENALNKLEAAYGTPYINALKSMIKRIETGRSNESAMGTSESAFLNWVRGSVATTMFFNTRSALLQQLSLVNFTNWADNNPAAQAKAMANTKQWGKDWAMIFNSDWMKERRQGLKTDINESELVASLEGSNNSYKSLLNTLLKNGFALTKYGDNIAIATGGAAFFRNRANDYAKKGMSKEAAEKQAFLDFQEIAEETQQSSRQDLLSNQQVTTFGKFFLAFANTPMQMTRLTKKAFLDLANGRGDAKSNISKIVYYGAVQNMIFSALQNALFAAIFSDEDDEEDEKLIDGKTERAINNVLDSLLRGSGIAGSAIATVKNVILRAQKEFNKGYKGDDTYILLEAANIAPPIGIKARKLYGAYKNYKMNQKTVKYIGFDNINHPYYGIAGATASGVLNIPLDRVMTKANNLKEAFDSQNEAWQRIALSLGYSTWELGIKDEEIELARRLAKQKLGKPKKTSLKSNLKGSLGTNKLKGSLD